MPIEASEPTVLSATYDKWAFTFATSGDGCVSVGQDSSEVQPILANVTLVKARVRDDGVWEKSPDPRDTERITIPDLYALAGTDPTVAAALAALIAAVQSVAEARGAL